ncbi:MAG: hypothetical protein IIA89_01310 [Chloroflexi bacterium]|nr:hypothetical protein [Chloroflexota bacterium]
MPVDIKATKLLIVEGTHEVSFFLALLRHLGRDDIQSIDVGGESFFQPNLENLQTDSNWHLVTSIGIVRDADHDFQAKLQSVQYALGQAGLPAPDAPLVPAGDHPQVRIFIMPDNGSQGSLEDLCLSTLQPSADLACVDEYIECLAHALGPHPHLSKARVQAYLASKPEGNIHMGNAAQKGYWEFESGALDDLKPFLMGM